MRYLARNKKTGVIYGPYTEAEKMALQSTPSTDVYFWQEIPAPRPAERPLAVKEVEQKQATKPKRQTRKKKKSDDDGNKN